ncbi:MAG: helix-turn-helix transcriptional regulator [Nanoarchaeota archaeon]|nr:helix-turn-helix transcriptional regulator [Nanoarchaeota archaeon]
MSQDDLAKKLDVSKNYISLVENDKKDPSINFLKNIAKLLNIPLVLLIWEKIDLPKGKTKEEKEIRKQIDKMVDKAHNLFAERTLKLKLKK